MSTLAVKATKRSSARLVALGTVTFFLLKGLAWLGALVIINGWCR